MYSVHYEIILQDHDRVEERNLCRQNFFAGDLGKFKSRALAERLSANYRRPVGYKIVPFGLHRGELNEAPTIYIGCVDNAGARKELDRSVSGTSWWIDSGNGYQSGQVLIGNEERNFVKGSFFRNALITSYLPKPSIQLPSILIPVPEKQTLDCATAVRREEQSPVINQMMATLVLQAVHQLINDRLNWMATYVDLEAGTLSTIHIEPETVARVCGVQVDSLFNRDKV
jgi:hypothetical protein